MLSRWSDQASDHVKNPLPGAQRLHSYLPLANSEESAFESQSDAAQGVQHHRKRAVLVDPDQMHHSLTYLFAPTHPLSTVNTRPCASPPLDPRTSVWAKALLRYTAAQAKAYDGDQRLTLTLTQARADNNDQKVDEKGDGPSKEDEVKLR